MKWIIFLFVAIGVITGFFMVGLPYFNEIQAKRPARDYADEGVQSDGIRYVEYKIAAEEICKDFISLEVYEKCSNSTNCEATCMEEGCSYFQSNYVSYSFRNNECYCNCTQNVYKKVLPKINKPME